MSQSNDDVVDTSRVIAHLDIDCFGVQLARQYDPYLNGKPCVTRISYPNEYPTSVSYEAKQMGVSKSSLKQLPYNEWYWKYPSLHVVNEVSFDIKTQVSNTFYKVIDDYMQQTYNDLNFAIEYNSLDDLYIDITDICEKYAPKELDEEDMQTLKDVVVEGGRRAYSLGDYPDSRPAVLTEAALVVSELCDEILSETQLEVSAGISYNKFLSKIACGLNKPNTVTLLSGKRAIDRILETFPIEKTEGLKGTIGQQIREQLDVEYLMDLRQFSRRQLKSVSIDMADGHDVRHLRATLKGLWDKCRGIDNNPVYYELSNGQIEESFFYDEDIDCNDYDFTDDLREVCNGLADKLEDLWDSRQQLPKQLRIECYTPLGHNYNKTVRLRARLYESNDIYNKVKSAGFPPIHSNVQYITGFTLIAIDLEEYNDV